MKAMRLSLGEEALSLWKKSKLQVKCSEGIITILIAILITIVIAIVITILNIMRKYRDVIIYLIFVPYKHINATESHHIILV